MISILILDKYNGQVSGTHKSSFRNIPKCHTTLSSYIWKEKYKKVPHFVNWSIKARGHPFSSEGWAWDLCLTEKLVILMANQNSMLNKRDELLETCRHQRKYLLISVFEPPKEKEPLTPQLSNGEPKHFSKYTSKNLQISI